MIRLIPSLLIPILVVSWTLFSACHAEGNDLFTKGSQDGNSANKTRVPLAAARTHRIDPTNDFKYYDGGWDITNTHYYMSLAFSGFPPVVVAVFWFVMVVICFSLMACLHCFGCCKKKSGTDYSRNTYVVSLIFIVLFLIISIIGGIFLYSGLERFQITTNNVLDTLITRANTVVDIIQNVITNLAAAKNLQVSSFTLPNDIKEGIEKAERFSNETDIIQSEAKETVRISVEFLNAISESLIIVGTMMLVLAVFGFLISFLGWHVIVYILLFFGWILVTITFWLSSLSLVVHNGVADSCLAIDEWVQNPRSESALSKLLPCMDEATTQRTLDISKNTSFQVVNLVNTFVDKVANANMPPMQADKDIYYNQSGPPLPPLCNPFFPNLTERKCDAVEVSLPGAPTVSSSLHFDPSQIFVSPSCKAYESFLCNISPSGRCITMGRLTPSLYTKVMVATNLSDSLHRHGPLLARLVDCSFVIDTFDEINKDDCPSFKRYSHQVFIGLVLVSTAVMFSVILWVIFVKERRGQISSKKFQRTLIAVQRDQERPLES